MSQDQEPHDQIYLEANIRKAIITNNKKMIKSYNDKIKKMIKNYNE